MFNEKMQIIFAFIVLAKVTLTYAAFQPSQKCQLSDSSCLKKAAQAVVADFTAGIPEIGIGALDPMHLAHVKVDLSGLKLNVKNAEVKGLKTSTIDKLSIDMATKTMQLTFLLDIGLKGKYKASGKLLILPISGDGDVSIKIKKLELELTMPFDIVKDSNGKDTIELKSYKFNYDVKENAHFHLTNLFNGNKALSDPLLTFMNENWKALTQEFGVPMLTEPVNNVFTAIKTYLGSQAIAEISL